MIIFGCLGNYRSLRNGSGTRKGAWFVVGDVAPSAELLARHPGLIVVRVPGTALARFPGGESALYLIDPLGNLVLRYADDPDIKGIARDLARVLMASRIG